MTLVEKLFALGIENLSALIVDDRSPDGTGELAELLSAHYPLTVMHRREKLGLGTAYVAAFSHLLKRPHATSPDYILEMDADLSHDPAAVPMLLAAVKNCDLVLGSRYVPGGTVVNWGILRRSISRLSNWYARFVLGVPYRDLTGGFKCYRRSVLEQIELASLSSVGYSFQIETTYRAHRLGYCICEVPITFTERRFGASKFNLGIMLESFIRVWRLARWRPKEAHP